MGRGEQGNNVMDVMTMNVITKNSHSFHGNNPWMAKDETKTGYKCNVGKLGKNDKTETQTSYETALFVEENTYLKM